MFYIVFGLVEPGETDGDAYHTVSREVKREEQRAGSNKSK
jgi:hypothetical protein